MDITIQRLNKAMADKDRMIDEIVNAKYRFDSIASYCYEEKLQQAPYVKIVKLYNAIKKQKGVR